MTPEGIAFLAAEVFISVVLSYIANTCDYSEEHSLVQCKEKPSPDNIDDIDVPTFSSYIFVEKELYYINKRTKEIRLMKLDDSQFKKLNAKLNPSGNCRILNIEELSYIKSFTNHENQKHAIIRYIVAGYPFFRESLKGLRYSYKGIRSALQIGMIFGEIDIRYLLVPIALGLGVVAALNKMWHRRMYKERKALKEENKNLLAAFYAIKFSSSLDEKYFAQHRDKIKNQDLIVKKAAFLSVTFNGIVDSFFQYLGLVVIATFPTALCFAMISYCVSFALILVITRIYDEYDYQRGLDASALRAETALLGREIEFLCLRLDINGDSTSYDKAPPLHSCSERSEQVKVPVGKTLDDSPPKPEDDVNDSKGKLEEKLAKFNEKRKELQKLVHVSQAGAVLQGLKSGLTAFSPFTSLIFTIAALGAIFLGTAFTMPPVVLLATVALGVLLLAGFTVRAVYKNRASVNNDPVDDVKLDYFIKAKESSAAPIKSATASKTQAPNELQHDESPSKKQREKSATKKLLDDFEGVKLAACEDGSENLRQAVTGFGKTTKFFDLFGPPLENLTGTEWNDSGAARGVSVGLGVANSVVYGLRSLARTARDEKSSTKSAAFFQAQGRPGSGEPASPEDINVFSPTT